MSKIAFAVEQDGGERGCTFSLCPVPKEEVHITGGVEQPVHVENGRYKRWRGQRMMLICVYNEGSFT